MKLNFLKLIFLGLSLAFFIMPEKTFAFEPPPLIFSEIAWVGSSASTADEWIELKNTTPEPLDITGWALTYLATEKSELVKKEFKIPEDTKEIPAGGYFLIYLASDKILEESVLDTEKIKPDLSGISPDINLLNDNLFLTISDKDGELIDQVGEEGKPFDMDKNKQEPKATMVRVWPPQDGTQSESWMTQTSCFNLDSCDKDLATPGVGEVQIQNFIFPQKPLSKFSVVNLEADLAHSENPDLIDKAFLDLSFWEGPNDYELPIQKNPNPPKIIFVGVLPFQKPGKGQAKLKIRDSRGFDSILEFALEVYELPGKILINEILPNPQDVDWNKDGTLNESDEWIEIYNTEDREVSLTGFELFDKSGKGFKLPDEILGPYQYRLFFKKETGLALNNDGEEIIFKNFLGEEIQKISYEKSFPDFSYSLDENNNFVWTTTPTPGEPNKISLPPAEENEPPRPTEFPRIKTGEIANFVGQWIEIEALVVEPEGSTFYIDDGSGRLKVYLQEKTGLKSPGLKKGYKVKVKGLVNVYRDVVRLLPRISSDIEILEKPEPLTTSSSSTPTTTALSEQTAAVSSATTNQTTNDGPPAEVIVETIKITTTTFPKLEMPEIKIAPLNFNLESEPFSSPINKQIPLFGLWEIFLIGSFSLVLKFIQWI